MTADSCVPTATDLLVIGSGISGLSLAFFAAQTGRSVAVLEASTRPGGCIDSRRDDHGYWFELGAHTCYNSYGELIAILEQLNLVDQIVPRGDARKRFGRLVDGKLRVMSPLSVFGQFNWLELLASLPGGLLARKRGQSMRTHFARLVGQGNFDRVLGPFLAAVPSQSADDFPAEGPGSLFKKRSRRKDITKTWTLRGGLGTVVDALTQVRGVDVALNAAAVQIMWTQAQFHVTVADGRTFVAPRLALAVPPPVAAGLVAAVAPDVAAVLAQLRMAAVDSVGVALDKSSTSLPELAFVVPVADVFHSAVTRDPVPDPDRRGFAFHFKPGFDSATQQQRMVEVLGCQPADLHTNFRRHTQLPSPVVGHDATIAALDQALQTLGDAGVPLALTGNYFAGLAIEDCIARSHTEWTRLASHA